VLGRSSSYGSFGGHSSTAHGLFYRALCPSSALEVLNAEDYAHHHDYDDEHNQRQVGKNPQCHGYCMLRQFHPFLSFFPSCCFKLIISLSSEFLSASTGVQFLSGFCIPVSFYLLFFLFIFLFLVNPSARTPTSQG
jgi:hypothetical protein